VEEEIEATEEQKKLASKSYNGTISELRKRAKKLLRCMAGKEQDELPFMDAPPPLDLCEPEWMKIGGSHVFIGAVCSKCGAVNQVAARHEADPKDCKNPTCEHTRKASPARQILRDLDEKTKPVRSREPGEEG